MMKIVVRVHSVQAGEVPKHGQEVLAWGRYCWPKKLSYRRRGKAGFYWGGNRWEGVDYWMPLEDFMAPKKKLKKKEKY